jgi:hypothetical protein
MDQEPCRQCGEVRSHSMHDHGVPVLRGTCTECADRDVWTVQGRCDWCRAGLPREGTVQCYTCGVRGQWGPFNQCHTCDMSGRGQ